MPRRLLNCFEQRLPRTFRECMCFVENKHLARFTVQGSMLAKLYQRLSGIHACIAGSIDFKYFSTKRICYNTRKRSLAHTTSTCEQKGVRACIRCKHALQRCNCALMPHYFRE